MSNLTTALAPTVFRRSPPFGLLRRIWMAAGGPSGALGRPLAAMSTDGDVTYAEFEQGSICTTKGNGLVIQRNQSTGSSEGVMLKQGYSQQQLEQMSEEESKSASAEICFTAWDGVRVLSICPVGHDVKVLFGVGTELFDLFEASATGWVDTRLHFGVSITAGPVSVSLDLREMDFEVCREFNASVKTFTGKLVGAGSVCSAPIEIKNFVKWLKNGGFYVPQSEFEGAGPKPDRDPPAPSPPGSQPDPQPGGHQPHDHLDPDPSPATPDPAVDHPPDMPPPPPQEHPPDDGGADPPEEHQPDPVVDPPEEHQDPHPPDTVS